MFLVKDIHSNQDLMPILPDFKLGVLNWDLCCIWAFYCIWALLVNWFCQEILVGEIIRFYLCWKFMKKTCLVISFSE